MAQFDLDKHVLVGPGGSLSVREDDEITRKLLMLMEGECEELGPLEAATKFGFSKQRYFQLRTAFNESVRWPYRTRNAARRRSTGKLPRWSAR